MGAMMRRAKSIVRKTGFTALFDKGRRGYGYHTGSELDIAQQLGIRTLVAIASVRLLLTALITGPRRQTFYAYPGGEPPRPLFFGNNPLTLGVVYKLHLPINLPTSAWTSRLAPLCYPSRRHHHCHLSGKVLIFI